MNVMRITKIIMPLLLLAMLNCRPASAEISVDGDWGKARFYASLRLLLTHESGRKTDIADGVSRAGIRGHVNLTDDWQGTFRLEGRIIVDEGRLFAQSNEFHKRLSWIGLKNEQFGEFRGGKQLSPHYLWTLLPIDITFHNPRHYNIRHHATENSSLREANSLAWFSPSYGGLQFGALAEIDRADNESSLVDSYNLAARYRHGPWQLAVSYYDRSDNLRTNNVFRPDAKTAASTLQFRQGPHKAVLRYQHEAIKTQPNFNTLGAYYSYNFNSGVELQGRVYRLAQGPLAGFQSAVGVVKKFKKYGRLFLEYTDYDADAARLKGRQDDLTAGLRIDF